MLDMTDAALEAELDFSREVARQRRASRRLGPPPGEAPRVLALAERSRGTLVLP